MASADEAEDPVDIGARKRPRLEDNIDNTKVRATLARSRYYQQE